MSARHDARSGEDQYRNPTASAPFAIGSTVRCASGVGIIEFVAFSSAMASHVYTVALNTRIKLRLVASDIELLQEPA